MNGDQDVVQAIAWRIRTARVKAGLKQDELAARIGLVRSSVANMEGGRQELTVAVLYRIAGATNVAPAWLLVGSGETPTGPTEYVTPAELASVANQYQAATDRLMSMSPAEARVALAAERLAAARRGESQ